MYYKRNIAIFAYWHSVQILINIYIMKKRTLIELPYEMAGSDVGFYEENTYNAILDLAIELPKETQSDIAIVKALLSAVSSSPYAVLEVLEKNKVYLTCFF